MEVLNAPSNEQNNAHRFSREHQRRQLQVNKVKKENSIPNKNSILCSVSTSQLYKHLIVFFPPLNTTILFLDQMKFNDRSQCNMSYSFIYSERIVRFPLPTLTQINQTLCLDFHDRPMLYFFSLFVTLKYIITYFQTVQAF